MYPERKPVTIIWLLTSADISAIEHLQFKMQLLAVDKTSACSKVARGCNVAVASTIDFMAMHEIYIIISLYQLTTTVQLQLSIRVPNY